MNIASRAAPIALLILLTANAGAYEFNAVFVGGRSDPNGDPLGPQLGVGIDWHSASPVRWYMNEAGQIAFNGRLSGVGSAADTGIWRWTNGTKQLLARENDQVGVLPVGAQFDEVQSIYGMSLGIDGSVLFSGFLKGSAVTPDSDESFMLANPDGSLTVIAREGDQAAGFGMFSTYKPELEPGHPIFRHDLTAPLLSPDGQVFVGAQIAGQGITASNNRLLYLGTPDNLQLIAREGNPAPGMIPGATFGPNVGRSFIANGGQQTFGTDIINPDTSVTEVLYRYDSGTYTLIAVEGAASGVPGRTFRGRFLRSNVNTAGGVTFTASLSNSNVEGLFKASAGSADGVFEVLAGPGVAAPGTGGATFSNNPGSMFMVDNVLTASGDVAFLYDIAGVSVDGFNDRGIWIDDSAGTRLALREGDAAGSLSGVTIGTIREFTFNDNQNLIVISDLVGAVTPSNDRAMWLIHPGGDLELLLREGDLFDVDPSTGVDNRTIANLRLGGYADSEGYSRAGAFNDGDQLAFALDFSDGRSGLFVTDLTPVPEPTSIALLALGIFALSTRRRSHMPT